MIFMKVNYKNADADKNYYYLKENPSKIPFYFTYHNTEYHGLGGEDFVLIDKETTTNEAMSMKVTMAVTLVCITRKQNILRS